MLSVDFSLYFGKLNYLRSVSCMVKNVYVINPTLMLLFLVSFLIINVFREMSYVEKLFAAINIMKTKLRNRVSIQLLKEYYIHVPNISPQKGT